MSFIYVVRHPYTRLVSLWQESQSREGYDKDLDTFVNELVHDSQEHGDQWINHDWASRRRLQFEFVDLSNSVFEDLSLSLNRLRFECLQHDFAKLCSDLGLPSKSLEYSNQSPTAGHKLTSRVTAATLEEINFFYRKDFEQFGYDFDEPP